MKQVICYFLAIFAGALIGSVANILIISFGWRSLLLTPDLNQDQATPSQPEESPEEPVFGASEKVVYALQLLEMSAKAGSHTGLFGASQC